MRRVLAALCLAVLAATFVACGGRINPPPGPAQPEVEVTAEQLAQDFTDDFEAANSRYGSKTLVISGTVGRLTKPRRYDLEPGPDDDVEMALIFVPVTDKKTGGQRQYELRCSFRPALSAEGRKELGLEKGKRVTLRGRYEVGYRDKPLVGIGNCSVVSVGGP
jgi:hypothetical protein